MSLNGIICINKPEGFTSFDVIAKMRGILKMKKLGHSGTLDPMATGVLPVFVGNSTRAINLMPNKEKRYVAGFRLGIVTDTQDTTGKVISETVPDILEETLRNAVGCFVGEISQIPPMYSAVSVGGKRLYELARKGIEIEREARKITVYSLDLLEYDTVKSEGKISVLCSGGTYVRTLIHYIGQLLGCGAVMTSLVRTSSNGFTLSDCIKLEQLEALKNEGNVISTVIPVDRLFMDIPALRLNEMKTSMYKNGVKLRLDCLEGFDDNERYRIYSDKNQFLGLAVTDNKHKVLKILKNLYQDGEI